MNIVVCACVLNDIPNHSFYVTHGVVDSKLYVLNVCGMFGTEHSFVSCN